MSRPIDERDVTAAFWVMVAIIILGCFVDYKISHHDLGAPASGPVGTDEVSPR